MNNPTTEAFTGDQVNSLLDKAIATLEFLKDMIPGKIDDLAVSFLKWGRNDPTLQAWILTFNPPPPNAVVLPPEVLLDAFRRWHTETGSQPATQGGWMELLGLVMQIVTWIKNRQTTNGV